MGIEDKGRVGDSIEEQGFKKYWVRVDLETFQASLCEFWVKREAGKWGGKGGKMYISIFSSKFVLI